MNNTLISLALLAMVSLPPVASAGINSGSGVRAGGGYVLEDSLGGMTGPVSSSANWQFAAGDLFPDFALPQIAYIRSGSDYSFVTLPSKIVTAGTDNLNNAFYIQDHNALAGIRVDRNFLTTVFTNQGDWVDVTGTLITNPITGERYIRLNSIAKRFTGQPHPDAWTMINRTIGGGATGSMPGITGAAGINNIGLLISSWGTVTFVDPGGQYFYIDDGTGLYDGSGNLGVRVILSGLAPGNSITPPQPASFVKIKGVSSVIKINGNTVRAIRVRTQSDIQSET